MSTSTRTVYKLRYIFSSGIIDESGEDQPKPFEFYYQNTVRVKHPSLPKDEMHMLLGFLDRMLQLDPHKRATPTVLLDMPWLQSQYVTSTKEEA